MNQHLERLDDLAPVLQKPATEFIRLAEARRDIRLFVVWTFRSPEKQWEIYQQGRSYDRELGEWVIDDVKQVVTRAKPGQTSHNVVTLEATPAALALDVVPIRDGSLWWAAPDAVWHQLYELAADCGLDPYGDAWGAYLEKDKGHFEEPGWKMKLEALGLTLPSGEAFAWV